MICLSESFASGVGHPPVVGMIWQSLGQGAEGHLRSGYVLDPAAIWRTPNWEGCPTETEWNKVNYNHKKHQQGQL